MKKPGLILWLALASLFCFGQYGNNFPVTTTGTQNITGQKNFKNIDKVRYVDDTNSQGWAGSDIGAWINSAFADCSNQCTVKVSTNSSGVSFSTTINITTQAQSLIGSCGGNASLLNYTGTGDGIRIKTNPFTITQAGRISCLQIVGTSSSTGAGIHMGDVVGMDLDHVIISGFTNAAASCLWLDNTTNWTERNYFHDVQLGGCQKNLRFTVNGGQASFGYNDFIAVHVDPLAGQIGISIENNSNVYSNNWIINGNILDTVPSPATFISLANTAVAKIQTCAIRLEQAGSLNGTLIANNGTSFECDSGGILVPNGNGLNTITGTGTNNFYLGGIQGGAQLPNIPVESPNTIASRDSSSIGAYLLPRNGSNSSLEGLGVNCFFDGTNNLCKGDGASNGGLMMLGTPAATLNFYAIPSTGAADQTVAPGSLGGKFVGQFNTNGLNFNRITYGLALTATNILAATTAPTIAGAGCGGSAATIATNNGTAAFSINVGTAPTTACTVTLTAAANGWNCFASDITTQSTSIFLQKQTASGTTSATITNYNTAGTATNFVASDIVNVSCLAR